ncbi:MAG: hypothetical protein FWF34_00200, partial [Alphaproteobacteria bacterium]|nr:hypothetical protein [Alphaproteobacteria bacterium]
MRKLFITFCLLFFVAAAGAATVSRIDVSGNRRMDAESVRLLADVKIGDNLNKEDLNRIAKKISASGMFSAASATMSGSILRLDVTESPVVNIVTIEGNNKVSADDLRKEIRLRERSAYDESVIGADVQRMLMVYQRQGYFGTKIEPQRIDLDGGRVNVVYEVTEGRPTHIRDIKFTGNKKFSSRTLRGEILSREYAWYKFMASFDVYDEDRIKYDEQMLRQFYMRHGFVDVQVRTVSGTFSADREWYSVTFEIEEGKQFRFGTLKIENPFPDVDDGDLKRLLKMRRGDIYNIDEVEQTISAIRGFVGDRGYAFINVDVIPEKDDEKRTIDLVFKIQKTNRMY